MHLDDLRPFAVSRTVALSPINRHSNDLATAVPSDKIHGAAAGPSADSPPCHCTRCFSQSLTMGPRPSVPTNARRATNAWAVQSPAPGPSLPPLFPTRVCGLAGLTMLASSPHPSISDNRDLALQRFRHAYSLTSNNGCGTWWPPYLSLASCRLRHRSALPRRSAPNKPGCQRRYNPRQMLSAACSQRGAKLPQEPDSKLYEQLQCLAMRLVRTRIRGS